jgi:Cu/Ag efflux pump CusA
VRSFRDSDGPADPVVVNQVTRERAVPILLGALTMVAAVVPLLALGRVAGTETLFPFAVVTMGALLTATAVSILVLPSLYLRLAAGGRALADPDREPRSAEGER